MAIGSETTARHFGSGVFSWLLLGEEDIVITSKDFEVRGFTFR